MKRYTKTHWIRIVVLSLMCLCAASLMGCNDDDCKKDGVNATVGSLNINATPASATVVVTGPDGFTETFTGNQFLSDLEPGEYRVDVSAPEFYGTNQTINVVAGHTSSISLALQASSIISEAPRAVYRDDKGNLIPIDIDKMSSGQFVFYAWLEDKPSGINTNKLNAASVSDPGKPLVAEQKEDAPSFTQNLAAAWVGFKDDKGVVRPVIGADVRWEIDQWYTDRVNSMQFGTSDDNRVASDYGIYDDMAYTRTNNSRLEAERFPFAMSEYPLYNKTGVSSPFVDGFTWVTLFSPDAEASGRIVAVATIDGEEIGKQILYKNFAPAPELQITKKVDKDIVNLVNGTASVTWTVTVKNVGLGDADKVDLKDILASGAGASYTLSSLPAGSTPVGDGFTLSFPLPAGENKVLTFTGTVTEPGTYCNEAQILDLEAQACFTALESNVSIIKDFVANDNTTSLGKSLTVAANEVAKLRVRVTNKGTGAATGVKVNDVLTSGGAANYEIITPPTGSTRNSTDGFDITIGNLAAGATETLLFTVKASSDGVYCDTATVTATSGNIGIGSDRACLTVATPKLDITKVDAPKNVLPGATYTSTIVVRNTGTAAAKNVVISDSIGLNSAANVRAVYVSSSLDGLSGTLAGNTVTAKAVDIKAGGSITFTVVSRIPLGAASGTYCNTAKFTSDNAGTKQAEDCVNVPAFSALQTQLIDLNDPVAVGSNVTYFSTLYVETLSNEGVGNNKLTFSFGLTSPDVLGIPGVFKVISTSVYLDTKPIRDPVTGSVVSDSSNATAQLEVEGTDYTLSTQLGKQVITMTPRVVLQPDTALYVAHVVEVPSGTPTNKMYTTSYIWDAVGLVNPGNTYESSSSEPTTVLP
ncbi:MAG: DUF11 domain-containing protein [Desulfobacteraceae bacterium]|nr:MAG: DUF11 domain-containing protein [Desulfobacteraceae bacterium]